MVFNSIKAITSLWLAQNCPLCDRATSAPALCDACWRQMQRQASPQPITSEPEALPLLSWGPYGGALKQALTALKYNGHRALAAQLGNALGDRWQREPIPTRQPPLVVPIPLHPDKLKQRGFNQAALLADGFCRQTGLRQVTRGLVRQRATVPQFGLGATERQTNLANAFTLGSAFDRRPQQPVLLLDDIYTTGSTVRSAAATLRQAGISVCGVAVIARARSAQHMG